MSETEKIKSEIIALLKDRGLFEIEINHVEILLENLILNAKIEQFDECNLTRKKSLNKL